jgi:hypothetical protein
LPKGLLDAQVPGAADRHHAAKQFGQRVSNLAGEVGSAGDAGDVRAVGVHGKPPPNVVQDVEHHARTHRLGNDVSRVMRTREDEVVPHAHLLPLRPANGALAGVHVQDQAGRGPLVDVGRHVQLIALARGVVTGRGPDRRGIEAVVTDHERPVQRAGPEHGHLGVIAGSQPPGPHGRGLGRHALARPLARSGPVAAGLEGHGLGQHALTQKLHARVREPQRGKRPNRGQLSRARRGPTKKAEGATEQAKQQGTCARHDFSFAE